MIQYRLIKLDTGGFVVKDGFSDNVFASTRIDESLMFIRTKMSTEPYLLEQRERGPA